MTAQQLKNSILQLAVQGKLVPQDPNDEPASVLLERIRAEKEELIKAKKIKREKNPSVIFRGADNTPYEKIGNEVIPLDVPFDIPDTWEWIRGSSLGEIVRGSGIKRTETVEAGLPCVRYGELYTTYNISFSQAKSFIPKKIDDNCKHFSYGDVLMTLTGENKPDIAKAVAYLGETPIAAGGDLAFWTHHGLNPLYLVYLLNSPYAIYKKVELATGDIIVHISGDKIGSILLPIPPLAEQERIVQQIQELETIVSEYGKKETELTQLQASFPEQMKKSILQWAVQGKLVPQDPTDQPADILLDRIRAEKESLIKAGKIKRDKHESVIFRRDNSHYEKRGSEVVCIDDELPFEIPASWRWVRAQTISTKEIKRGKSPQYTENSTVYVFAQKCNVKAGGINMRLAKFLDVSAFCRYPMEEQMIDGDIIVNSTGEGTLGRIGIFRDSDRLNDYPIVPDSHVAIIRTSREFAENYIYYVFRYYQAYLESLGEGSTKQTELKPAVLAEFVCSNSTFRGTTQNS